MKGSKFAEGYELGEPMGENLTMNDEFRTVAEEPVVYKFAQKHAGVRFMKGSKFAEGYEIGESMGENLTMNDEFRTVAEEPVVYKFAQKNKQQNKRFAEGYGDEEEMR